MNQHFNNNPNPEENPNKFVLVQELVLWNYELCFYWVKCFHCVCFGQWDVGSIFGMDTDIGQRKLMPPPTLGFVGIDPGTR